MLIRWYGRINGDLLTGPQCWCLPVGIAEFFDFVLCARVRARACVLESFRVEESVGACA